MPIITIPKGIKKIDDLITIPRKEYEELIALKKIAPLLGGGTILEKDILRWSREAQKLKKMGKLPMLRSLRALR